MKRLVLITGIIIYVLFGISAFFGVSAENKEKMIESTSATPTQSATLTQEVKYILKSIDGKLVILDYQGNILEQTDTMVSILPENDRKKLESGISVSSDDELRKLLEDLCS